MMEKIRVQFRVRVLRLKLWEKILVCGSDASLGEWDPLKAFPLIKSPTDRWESFLLPRSMQLLNNQNSAVDDMFGNYAGNCLVSDGWIIHNEENVVLLRVHSEALKFYKNSHKGKEHRVKVVPFDVRFKEQESVDDDAFPDTDPVLPDVPSFSNTQLSVLSREDPIFGQQYVNGSVFRNKIDYLIFKTHTVSLEHLAFRIELFHEMDRIGLAYALPAALPDLYGKATFPIISLKNIPIGQIDSKSSTPLSTPNASGSYFGEALSCWDVGFYLLQLIVATNEITVDADRIYVQDFFGVGIIHIVYC
ncbi:unnamed protein product [Strongylus vulgaris]|uniref:CBM20 domain-containing protein n=1 Tax=Strongylus vulgaris TaxID=40348 RepID=A0A3P7IZJ5_STRVU|nr:unnamed protein product [Strongylus vulgaris]